MRRKVIKQGHSTLTITLPSNWTKRFNLKQGSEIDLIERDNGLFLSTETKNEKKIAVIDLSDLDIPTIWKYLMAVYREGYDEIKVLFDSKERYDNPYKFYSAHAIDIKYGKKPNKYTPLETMQFFANRFIGFEIIENHPDYCIMKDMGQVSSKEFDSSLRRVFLLIQQLGEDTVEALKTNNPKLIEHAHDIDINIDKFHDYCLRVLNKTGFKDIKKSHLIFTALYILELIGDEFKRAAYHIVDDMKGRGLSNLISLARMITDQFNLFYDFFYNFKREKIIEISNKNYDIHFYMTILSSKNPGERKKLTWEELETLNHFRRIGHYINALVELRVEMEY